MRIAKSPLVRLRLAGCASLVILATLWVLVGGGVVHAQSDAVDREIRTRIQHLLDMGALQIGGTTVAATSLLSELYVERRFKQAWWSERNSTALLNEIRLSVEHGFDPEDFHLSQIMELMDWAEDENAASLGADLDILMSDAAARLAYGHYFGKVDPARLDDAWNFDRPVVRVHPAATLNDALNNDRVDILLEGVKLAHPWHNDLLAALARYRAIAAQGGWSKVPAGPSLKPGMTEARIPALRSRLAVTGDWNGSDAGSESYDTELLEAVYRFQVRHGLEVDGVVGPRTLKALNVPVGDRIDQIRVSLERGRWVLRNLTGDFVAVNIAGFRTYLIRDDQVVWTTRSIVGRDFRQTPVFKDRIRYMDFNPNWTVPPGILAKDVIPKARKDPSYIASKGFEFFDRNGRQVDSDVIDWSTARAAGFPYRVVQPPGPNNALGLVKFMFPNRHFVYLHDTPTRDLFDRTERAFSSGCVRVENPFQFADLLLADKPGWDRARIDEVVASGVTTTVHMETPLPVLLLYWTAWAESDGQVQFRRDIYERDGRILEALNGDFKLRPTSISE